MVGHILCACWKPTLALTVVAAGLSMDLEKVDMNMAIDGGVPLLRPDVTSRHEAIPDDAQQKAHAATSETTPRGWQADNQPLPSTIRSSGFRRPLRWATPDEVMLHHQELRNAPSTRTPNVNPYTQLPDRQLVKALGDHFSVLENFHEK